jgi:hypothetical protein
MKKVRRCVWIEERSLLLLQMRGMTPTSILSKILPVLLELPEDPSEALIKKQTEEVVLRLRSTYERELRDRIRDHTAQQELKDLDRAVADQRVREVLSFGDMLQKTTCWPRVQTALQDLDAEAPCWEIATREIQVLSGNGKDWDVINVWNMSIDWWKRYGRNGSGTKVQGKI